MVPRGLRAIAAMMDVPIKQEREEYVLRMAPRGNNASLRDVTLNHRGEEFVTGIARKVVSLQTARQRFNQMLTLLPLRLVNHFIMKMRRDLTVGFGRHLLLCQNYKK
jgi:hypothetical protein